MSSKGEVFGGILGLAVGSLPGGLTLWQGLQIGSAIGGMFAPNDQSLEQGRLADVRGSGSSQGVPIPKIYGRERVGCIVIYASDIREVKVHSGGGGKK